MKKTALLLLTLAFAFAASAGTLIYTNREGKKLTVSGIKIFSIDSKKMVVKINDGTETILLSNVVKYYDTDIKSGSAFDDNSAEYSIRLGEGILSDKKKSGQQTFSISFDVSRKSGRMDTQLRYPYIYLFVLTSGEEGNRVITSYPFPSEAKASMKNYDEAKMLEKVLSLKRKRYHSEDADRLGERVSHVQIGGAKMATFSLNNIKNRKVIAWYVVAWGKDSIVAVKEWRDTSYKIGKNWWIR